MLDPVTLDQLRTLIAVADYGSFSAAARQLRRVQSAVSMAMANLEKQLGIVIWNRSGKGVVLTDDGAAVLTRARRVVGEVDALRSFASKTGGEQRVTMCVDALFPIDAVVEACAWFAKEFPETDLHLETETMAGVSKRIAAGTAQLGIVSMFGVRPGLATRPLGTTVKRMAVVAPNHPLAAIDRAVTESELNDSVQIVLAERDSGAVPAQAVLSSRTWRVADLSTKHALLLRGLGWGNPPEHVVRDDVMRGSLVRLQLAPARQQTFNFFAVHRYGEPLGRAHEALLDWLETQVARAGKRAV